MTFLVNQARQLKLDGRWDVTYFTAPRSREQLVAAVGTDHVRTPFRVAPGYVRRFAWEQVTLPRILRDEGFDLLYAPGGFAALRSSVPQVVVDHNAFHHAGWDELGSLKNWMRFRVERWLARLSARRAEAVVYLSRAFADAMLRVGFPEPTAIIGSGVSTDWPSSGSSLLACDVCSERGYVLAVHNWTPAKRLDWLLDAWSETAGREGPPHLVLVGSPVNGDVEASVRGRLEQPRLRECVHVYESATRAQVARFYEAARLYVSTSTLEAFPLTPYEAMHFGVPCVLSDIAEHREVAGDAAAYFRPLEASSFRDAIGRAEALRSKLISDGRKRVSAATWARNVDEFSRLF
ncbi:MAG TPA: glycosyltransferase, partial [Thermoleophilaceae bacterium]